MPEGERGGNYTDKNKVDWALEKTLKYLPGSMMGGMAGLLEMNYLRADVGLEGFRMAGEELAHKFYEASWYWEPVGVVLGVAGGILATKYISNFLKRYMKKSAKMKNSERIDEENYNRFMYRCGSALGFCMSSPLPSIASMVYYANPEKAAGLADVLTKYGGSLLENLGINTAIHESSHNILATTLYDYTIKNGLGETIGRTVPIVHVGRWAEFNRQLFKEGWMKAIGDLVSGNGESSGKISICPTGLSDIGSILGKENSALLFAAAGTCGELATAISLYLVGRKIKRKAPVEGGLLQALSVCANLRALQYPVNTALFYMRNGTQLPKSDWSYISEVTGIDPTIFAVVFSTIYPAVIGGLYLRDRKKRKDKERRETAYRLISNGMIKKEDIDPIISDYIHKPQSILSRALPFGKRKKQLLRYGITSFDDFERCEKYLMEKLQEELPVSGRCGAERIVSWASNGMKKSRIKRSVKGLMKLKGYVVDDVARSDGFKGMVGMERKMYDELSSKYFMFRKDPEKYVGKLQKKLNIDDDPNVLKKRLERFYDGEGVAALTVYGVV